MGSGQATHLLPPFALVAGNTSPSSLSLPSRDKLYEKRKIAALEVEQIVKRLAAVNDQQRIRLIIDKLISEYAFSPQANHRKVTG